MLDRDGTICEDVGYLDALERLRLLPNSALAIAAAAKAGFQSVLVTNQAGVARGRFEENLVGEAHDRLRALLAERGARLDGIYYCPHHPEAEIARYRLDCECRKPRPGMLLRARDEMGIDLVASYVVGDRFRDLEAGARVGATPILVLTGHGQDELQYHAAEASARPEYVAEDLLNAVRWILEREASGLKTVDR
jgi:D-glycero-D-manno-heptose 1,7-bisphosphate phosphatase